MAERSRAKGAAHVLIKAHSVLIMRAAAAKEAVKAAPTAFRSSQLKGFSAQSSVLKRQQEIQTVKAKIEVFIAAEAAGADDKIADAILAVHGKPNLVLRIGNAPVILFCKGRQIILVDHLVRVILGLVFDQMADTVPDADQSFDPAFRGDRSIYRRHSAVFPVIHLAVYQREAEISDAWICRD